MEQNDAPCAVETHSSSRSREGELLADNVVAAERDDEEDTEESSAESQPDETADIL